MCFNVSNFETSKPPMATLLGTITDIPFKRRPFWVDDFPNLPCWDMFSGSLLPGKPDRLRPEPYRLRPDSEISMIITFRQNISSSLTVGNALLLSGRVEGQGWEQKALQTHRWLFHMFVGFPFKNTLWPNGTWNRTCFWLLEKSFNLFTFWMTAQSGQFCFNSRIYGVSKIHRIH